MSDQPDRHPYGRLYFDDRGAIDSPRVGAPAIPRQSTHRYMKGGHDLGTEHLVGALLAPTLWQSFYMDSARVSTFLIRGHDTQMVPLNSTSVA
jgi:hypothetical protein